MKLQARHIKAFEDGIEHLNGDTVTMGARVQEESYDKDSAKPHQPDNPIVEAQMPDQDEDDHARCQKVHVNIKPIMTGRLVTAQAI